MGKKGFSQFKLFLFSFSAALMILAGFFIAAVHILQSYPVSTRPTPTSSPLPEIPSSDLRMTLLIEGREKSSYDPELFVLLGFLPDQGRITVCVLPPAVAVTAQGQQHSIQEWARSGGLVCAASALSEYLNLPIDRTVSLSTAGLSAILKASGTFRCSIREGVHGQVHGHSVSLASGIQSLTGQEFADLLFFPSYSGGEEERADRADVLIVQLITHLLRAEGEGWGETLAAAIFNNCDSNLSYTDYHSRKSALSFLSDLNPPAATPVFLEGAWNHSRTLLYLTSSCRQRLQIVFQPLSIRSPEAPSIHVEQG